MKQPYSLKRSHKRKKTISLEIGNNSEITVYAPYFTPVKEINSFVEEKQNWIDRIRRRQVKLLSERKEKAYVTGENFYYLGQAYPLEAYFEPLENTGLIFWKKRFYLNCPPDTEMRKRVFASWYRKKAGDYLNARVGHFSRELDLRPPRIRITQAIRQWGSCSHDNGLAFSFRLIMAPPDVIDYVIVHELIHIRQKNHSSKFWQLVVEVIPHYQVHRRWLRDHQHLYEL